jgi:tRNA A-37 threonylcarbamoyl transferase component Bud32
MTVTLWCLLVVCGFFVLNFFAKDKLDRYFQGMSTAVNQLAEESGAILLEAEVLGLSRKVAEFTDEHSALFTAILDHENKVMAHSDPEQLNRIYEPLMAETQIKSMAGVDISVGQLPDGTDATTYTRAITFSGVQIGSVATAIPASKVQTITSGDSIYKIILLIVSTLSAGAGLAVGGRKRSLPPKPESADDAPGMDGFEIGPYRLREKIAQGGMAELYKADYLRRDGFRRTMAVKRVLPHLAENQDFINMFIREARLAALLQHPNIVQIFDFGKIQNAYFIAMEYIDGLNLGQMMVHLKSGLPVDMTIFLGIKISLGLDYSHKRKDDESGLPLGIVHRDISPQNILVSTQGEVKISDFGISKANTEPSLTQAGVIKGKLGYLSPEQALGQEVDHQCDIYALGLVLYEILTASRVYQFDSDIDAIRIIPEMAIVPLNKVRSDIPDGLNDIVMKCLEKDKALRYADARQLHDDLIQQKSRLQISYDASDLSNFMRLTFEHD